MTYADENGYAVYQNGKRISNIYTHKADAETVRRRMRASDYGFESRLTIRKTKRLKRARSFWSGF